MDISNLSEQVKTFWQHLPSQLPAVAFSIGGLEVRVYGLLFVGSFVVFYFLLKRWIKHASVAWKEEDLDAYVLWALLGAVIGGRLGYAVFYDLQTFLNHPLSLVSPVTFSDPPKFIGIRGMSYHGGAIGVFAATALFCRKRRIPFWDFLNFVVPAIPLGYMLGRLGNFFNGELYGRPTSMPWGMVFPEDPSGLLRHPSQLYEALFEGLLLFWLLHAAKQQPFAKNRMLLLYMIGYGTVRFVIEFWRTPDSHLGFVWGPFTMGQGLCAAMILLAVGLWRFPVFRTRLR